MFKSTGTQEACDENGIIIEIDGYALRYKENDRVMEFGAQPCPPSSSRYDALFNIYIPAPFRWLAPHADIPVNAEKGRQIEKSIVDALLALDCQARFTLPVTQ